MNECLRVFLNRLLLYSSIVHLVLLWFVRRTNEQSMNVFSQSTALFAFLFVSFYVVRTTCHSTRKEKTIANIIKRRLVTS